MRRVLASLLILLMTFPLVARGVAAPLMHMHPDELAQAAHTGAASHAHDHADRGEIETGAGADTQDSVAAHTDAGHSKDNSKDQGQPLQHGKVCDSNGACCGYLALSEASEGLFGLEALPGSWQTLISAGVKPTNPVRPPSPLLA